MHTNAPNTSRIPSEGYVVNIDGFLKKWSNFLIPEACYTTSYSGNKERELAVFLGKTDKPNI